MLRRAREFLRRANRQTREGEELLLGMAASADKGDDSLTGRVGDESLFGSRFTVNRETEEQQQLFAGLGWVKATVTVENGTDSSIILEKSTEQGSTVALSPEALAQDQGIQQAKDFLESPKFRRGLSIAKYIMTALGKEEFSQPRVFTVGFRNFPYSSLLALVKEEEREKPIHISWDITKAPVFLTATVVAEEILHALGIPNEQQAHEFVPLQACCGGFSLSGIKVQSTQMEEDVGLETLFVPIAKGLFDQTLDFIVEAFNGTIG